MHIISAANDGFIPHFAAMLHSAWLYHPDANYYLLDAGIAERNLIRLREFTESLGVDLTIFSCDALVNERLPTVKSRAHYVRWLIPELLANDIERALYLDGDMTVISSIDELYGIDLAGRAIAAIENGNPEFSREESAVQGIDFGDDYFNSGLMVMDLVQWRHDRIADHAFAYAAANHQKLPLYDQSSLNAILYKRNRKIDPIWNFFRPLEIEKLSGEPRILHYVSIQKPDRWPESPFADLYKFHRDQTPWPFQKFAARPWRDARRRIGASLGIKKYRKKLDVLRKLEDVRVRVTAPALERAKNLHLQRSR
ncbi:MAG TPA: glycosyltransferase family 8 protein [Afipia sp.]